MSSSLAPQHGPDGSVRYKKRKANFSFSEVHILLDEVRKNRQVVVGKFNSGVPGEVKKRKWAEITQRINEIGECDREVSEVVKKWSDLKCDTKRKIVALHSGSALPHSSDLTPTERIVGSILELDKQPGWSLGAVRARSRSDDQEGAPVEDEDDLAFTGVGLFDDSPRSGTETRPVAGPGAAGDTLDPKYDVQTNADTDSHVLDSDDDHHDMFMNSYPDDEAGLSNATHVSSSSASQAQAGQGQGQGQAPEPERESTREQLAHNASLSVQEQQMTNALLGTVSRSLELLAESVQQLAETQQEFVRESLRLQRETVHVLREFASGALTLLHERVNGKPPLF